jgi:hypothetical protein
MILKAQLFLLGMMVGLVDSNTANFTLLAVIAATTFGSAVLKVWTDSKQAKKLDNLQVTANNTHKLVNSESEKQLAINVVTLKALAIALDRIAETSKTDADRAAAAAAHVAVKSAEGMLVNHQIAQAGVDAVEQHRREQN